MIKNSVVLKISLVHLIILLFSLNSVAQSTQYKRKKVAPKPVVAKTAKSTKAKATAKTDKLDISGLEKKYWAPKDTDFSVVQNRTYTKVKRYAVTLQTGPMVNDAYSSGFDLALTGNYFFSERHGIEVSYIKSNAADNKTVDAFVNDAANETGIYPDHGKIQNHLAVGYNWVPFYAKVSLLNKKIIYFDMAFTPNIGLTSYDQKIRAGDRSKSSLAIGFDVSQYFFIHKNFAVRADLRNRWFKEEVLNYNSGEKIRDDTTNATTFLLGATFYF
ncbi:MAG: outer membrane beta-barrel domain-containing protein [Bdellovibrionaceae bacterium]|jgi:outer membrane beta-barrel protein|nr:outer membrane beta-barrel domain-containing protein [Pseudobdellovibrionaceae bacterium]